MLQLPLYVNIVFIFATFYTIALFWKATGYSKATIVVINSWLLVQGIAGYLLFYTDTKGLPPKFMLLIIPALLTIIALFVTKKGRSYIDTFDTSSLLMMNVVRIPVELVLFWLFLNKAVPVTMTFEGRNLDIISGITAIAIWCFLRTRKNDRILLTWNIVCLGLLVNIVSIAVIAAPFDFQKIAFDQPNIAVLYFPFVWLPCVIVPLVLLSHLAMIRKIIWKKRTAAVTKLSMSN